MSPATRRLKPRPRVAAVVVASLALAGLLRAQEWTTSGLDAQRTSWVRADDRLTKAAVERGEFAFLWKAQFDNERRQMNALTPPVLLDRLIGYRGFKSLAFLGGSADRVFAIDTDLARPYWTTHLNYSAATGGQSPRSTECPGGLTATPSRRTPLAPSAFGRGGGGRGATSGSAVGEPGRGAAILSQAPRGRGAAPAPASAAARGAAAPAGPVRASRGDVQPIPFGGVDPVYAVGSDGFLHTLRASNGSAGAPAVPFLPPGAQASTLVFIDGIVYTTTSNECGAVPNAVWAIDLTTPEHAVANWQTGGANIAGLGPAFGTDGTIYVAIGDDRPATTVVATGATRYANAIVALDRATLTPKDWFTAPGADFNATPVVFRRGEKDVVAATANDGRLYLLDGTSLGGADHRTPLAVSGPYTAPGVSAGLATWEDQGVRWILAPVSRAVPAAMRFAANGPAPAGSIVAFKVVDQGGTPALQPAWASRNIPVPLTPTVVNGLVIAVASGEYRGTAGANAAQRAQRSTPATLYVLDGSTGRQVWTSGNTMTSFARGGLAAGGGQVYVVTYDNTLYAFGIPLEH